MATEFKNVKFEEISYLINFVEHLNQLSRDSYRGAITIEPVIRDTYLDKLFSDLVTAEINYLAEIMAVMDKDPKMKAEFVFNQVRDSYFDNKELFEIMLESSEVFKLKPYLKL